MRASNISLTFMAAFASAFAGAFVGGFVVGLTGNVAVALLLLLPVTLGTAHLLGRWIARRTPPPTPTELISGCLTYVVLSALLGLGSRHGVGVVGFLISVGIGWVLYRAAKAPNVRSTPQTAG